LLLAKATKKHGKKLTRKWKNLVPRYVLQKRHRFRLRLKEAFVPISMLFCINMFIKNGKSYMVCLYLKKRGANGMLDVKNLGIVAVGSRM